LKFTKPLIGVAAAALATGIAVPTLAGSGNKYASESSLRDCDNGTVELVGPLKLWPPNHKMVAEPVTATADNSGDQVTITITPVITDAVGGDGGPQHDPDFTPTDENGNTVYASGTGSATAAVELRAERSGKGDGRTYRLDWMAQFGQSSCSSSTAEDDDVNNDPFVITVPHDMRGGAGWKAVKP
jgi:hypothetical protein